MKPIVLILTLCVLAGCTATDVLVTSEIDPHPLVVEEKTVEQLPSELSIPHFRTMTLVGTGLTLDSVLEKNDVYTKYAITYLSNGLKITGVFLIPNGDGPFPLLIFNHGYIAPSVYTQGRGLKREQDYMTRHGFAVLHTDYRGHAGSDKSPMTENVYDGGLEYAMDSANAILAVRSANLPTVDATKVGMLGHSMGGGITLAILTAKPELIDAAVLYAPVHAQVWENFVRWRAEREEGDRTVAQFGEPGQTDIWKQLSPDTFLQDIEDPILLFQGHKDKDVPKEWSDYLASRMTDLSKDFEYVEYASEGHEFAGQWSDFMKRSAEFFASHLTSENGQP